MDKKILLIGGGGHCKSVLDSLLATNNITAQLYSDIAIIDKKENIGKTVLNCKIIGSDEDLERLYNEGYNYAFITLGSIGDVSIRRKIYENLVNIGYTLPNIIDKSSVISKFINLENGIFIGKNVTINSDVTIKKCAIINTNCLIEHECTIGEFAHIAPASVLGGNVTIGDNAHIGLNSSLMQGIKIGENSLIGMGSVVLKNIGDNKKVFGNPCREVR